MHAPLMGASRDAAALLACKLALRSSQTVEEREAVGGLLAAEDRVWTRDMQVHEGDRLDHSIFLIEGCAARYKLTADGKRQIVSLHVAGDLVDLHTAVLKVADHSVGFFGPSRIARVPHGTLLAAARRHPGIAEALWRDSLVDAAISREWLLNVGRRDTYARTAHLYCEVGLRLEAMALGDRHRFVLPLSQQELGDATGVTPVHMNRTLQRMRADGLVGTHGSEVCVEDWDRLADAASFDPAYLYLPE